MRAVERPVRKRSGLSIYLAAASLLLAALLLPSAASAQWQTCGTNNICNTNTGNVGVGNTNPTNYPLTVQGSAGVGPAGQSYSVFDIIPGTAAAGQTTALRTFNSNKLQLTTWTGSAWNSGLTIDTSGNVGIGTAGPNGNLDVWAAAPKLWIGKSSATNPDANVAPRLLFGDTTAVNPGLFTFVSNDTTAGDSLGSFQWANYNLAAADKRVAGISGNLSGGANGGALTFTTANAGALAERMRIDNAGNVGVGTSAPTTRLTVTDGAAPYAAGATDLLQLKRGTANGADTGGTSILFANASNGFRIKYGGTTDRLSFLDGGSAEVLSLANGGNVGVGTASPQHKLDVGGSMAVGAGYTSSTTAPANGLIVQGGVGIGTSAPNTQQYMLDVNGSVNVSGNINAKYQDVAEWVASSQKLSAGTVVVLDRNRANQVLASTASYDTSVAGVVSARPGIALGEGGEGRVLVATTGRVKVRVDATRAPIQVGDLLVTSEAEGVAMKSVPVDLGGVRIHRPGTIIGKALEPLEKGTGEILVLLSLQ